MQNEILKNKPEISIVVPVYNTEQYLDACINSILQQSFENFELILIDDGSSDSSLKLCQQYLLRDNRIRVISKKNGGAASARNVGIDIAIGRFIMFCDSDDVVSSKWCEHLYRYADASEQVLPVCSFANNVNELGRNCTLQIKSNLKYSRNSYFLFKQAGIAGYVWNTIFKRELLIRNRIRFREDKKRGDYNEDLIFLLQYLDLIGNIIYCGYADYGYLTRQDSLSRGMFSEFYLDKYLEKYELWKSYLIKNNQKKLIPELADEALYHILTFLAQDVHQHIIMTSIFKKYVRSDQISEIARLAVSSNENSTLVDYIKNKKQHQLWIRLKAGQIVHYFKMDVHKK